MKALSRTITKYFRTAYRQADREQSGSSSEIGRRIKRPKSLVDFGRFILFVITQRKQAPNYQMETDNFPLIVIAFLAWSFSCSFISFIVSTLQKCFVGFNDA